MKNYSCVEIWDEENGDCFKKVHDDDKPDGGEDAKITVEEFSKLRQEISTDKLSGSKIPMHRVGIINLHHGKRCHISEEKHRMAFIRLSSIKYLYTIAILNYFLEEVLL